MTIRLNNLRTLEYKIKIYQKHDLKFGNIDKANKHEKKEQNKHINVFRHLKHLIRNIKYFSNVFGHINIY